MAMGQGGAKGWGFRLCPARFCLAPSLPHPAPHDKENFLIPSPPLGALRSPAPPCKTLLFVNFPYNKYNFFKLKLFH